MIEGIKALLRETVVGQASLDQIIINSSFALLIIIAGFLLGRIVSKLLKITAKKTNIYQTVRGSFVELTISAIKWAIYILFLNLGVKQVGITALTNFISKILVTIPAFIAAIVLIILGFALAEYFKKVLENSGLKDLELLSKTIYYFIFYVFVIYALRIALISLEETTINFIIIAITITAGFIAAKLIKKE